MHIINTTGNTISSQSSFSQYKYPNELPTCEWAGDETRSYYNYIRPISHLFQNDKNMKSYLESTFERLANGVGDSKVVSGCNLYISTFGQKNYVEIGSGAFIYNGELFNIFPEVKLTQEAIDSLFQRSNGSVEIGGVSYAIRYLRSNLEVNNEIITAKIINSLTDEIIYTISNAHSLNILSNLNNRFDNFLALANIEDISSLPVVEAVNGNVRFDNNTIVIGPQTTGTVFGSVVNNIVTDTTDLFTINGNKITDGSIANNKLDNNTITFGNTPVALGETIENLSNVTINDVTVNTVNNVLTISNGTITISSPASRTLGDAADRTTTDVIDDSTSGNLLPSVSAIRGYVSSGGRIFNGDVTIKGNTTFGNDDPRLFSHLVITDDGMVKSHNNTDASMTVNGVEYPHTAVDKTKITDIGGAFVINGGVAVEDSIFAAGDVRGRNVQSVSSEEAKENFSDFTESALDIINATKIYNYNYKSDPEKTHNIGIKAEEAHEYISTKSHKVLDHASTIALLIKAVQELSDRCNVLEEEIEELRNRK